MKQLLILFIYGLTVFESCKKDSGSTNPDTLKLIRHNWTVISARTFLPNGSNYSLLNDYQSFRSDNLHITTIKGINSTYYDTSKYSLQQGGSILFFYGIQNGQQSSTADTAYIRTVNDSLFVYYFKNSSGFVNFVDSLKR